jgi:hypothetical protein
VAIEFFCELTGWETLSVRIARWSQSNQWFAAAVLVVVASLLAHYFMNPFVPVEVAPSPWPSPLPTR